EVGAGGGDLYPHRVVREPAHRHASPSAAAVAAACGATTSGSMSALPRAVAVSLRPLPVTVHTMVAPAGTRPRSAAWSRPATLAADAGSTKTPTSRARSACASRIWASLTASIQPPDSSRAASASVQDAGLPMRIAV